MSNKSEYKITGTQKEIIMNADTQWIDLPNGTSINKAFMVEISLDGDGTRDNARRFADELKEIQDAKDIASSLHIISDRSKLQL